MSEWIPDLGNDSPVAPETVNDTWDPTWPYNFKWGLSAEGEVTVWRTKGGKDGRPGHRQELQAVWGRMPSVTEGDMLGLATYIPAEVRFDGTVIAPSEIRVQTYYGAILPQEIVRWFNQRFPNTIVRETAVVQNQLPMQKNAHLTKFAEADSWDAWNPIVETDEEETYKWAWNEKEGVLIFGQEEEPGQYPWKTHAEMVEETWARPLNGSDHLGYAVRVGDWDGANQIEMETYGIPPVKGVQAVKMELAKMFPNDEIILPHQYENDTIGPSSNLDYLASAEWARQNFSDTLVGGSVAAPKGILGRAGERISTLYRRALERLTVSATGADMEGCMVAFFVPSEIAEQLAQDDGEPAEQLHITLAYFVDKAEDRDDWKKVEEIVKRLSEKYPPFEGSINGYGIFLIEDGLVLWAAPNVKGINEFREELVKAVEEAGFPVSSEYEFTPHITLKYKYEFDGDFSNFTDDQLEVTFDKIAVAQGLDKQEFDLVGEGFVKETTWNR